MNEQQQKFWEDLQKVVARYRQQYDMPYSTAIGVLAILVASLTHEALDEEFQ